MQKDKLKRIFDELAAEHELTPVTGYILFGLYYDKVEMIEVSQDKSDPVYLLYSPEIHKAHSEHQQMALIVTAEKPDIREKAYQDDSKNVDDERFEYSIGIESQKSEHLYFWGRSGSKNIPILDFKKNQKIPMSINGAWLLSKLLKKIA